MKNEFLEEDVSVKEKEEMLKRTFKTKGIGVRKIQLRKEGESSKYIIKFPGFIYFVVEWGNNPPAAKIYSYVNEKFSEPINIEHPNFNKIVDVTATEFKKELKKQKFLIKLISLVLEGEGESTHLLKQ